MTSESLSTQAGADLEPIALAGQVRPRLLSYPSRLGVNDNPYNAILNSELEKAGVAVANYDSLGFAQSGDAFHLHWLERIYQSGRARRYGFLSSLAFRNLSMTMGRIKRKGGRIVWTVHNLRPHDDIPQRHRHAWESWSDRIYSQIDHLICMTPEAAELVKKTVPSVANSSVSIARHPHYRGVYTSWMDFAAARNRWEVPVDATLVSVVGYIRPYKGIEDIIEAFLKVHKENEYLLVAGKCHNDELKQKIVDLGRGSPNVRLHLESLSPFDLASAYKCSSISIFNFKEILNSGSVLTALSLDVPIVAPRVSALADLETTVGEEWVRLFTPPLTTSKLRQFLDQAHHRPAGVPDLSEHDPAKIAKTHVLAFGFDR